MKRGTHPLQALAVALFLMLAVWHLYSHQLSAGLEATLRHLALIIPAFIIIMLSLFLRGAEKPFPCYLESLIHPVRARLIGIACFALGGLHFITVRDEPIFLDIGFVVLLLAFFETAGIANRFLPALSGDSPQTTKDTMRRLMANQLGMLALVFVLSVVLLYLSLMVVMGFTDTFTVALLTAIIILALAFMTMVRNL